MNPLLIAPILEIGKTLIEKFFPDPQARAAAELELLKMQQSGALQEMATDLQLRLAQLEVNKAEATNPSLFTSGWRPAVGWVCVAALAWQFVGYPIASWAFSTWLPQVSAPVIVGDYLFELLFGMLGLAGLRSFEKVKGVAK
jgi:hypothetical protein